MTVDEKQLRELAEAATRGPWKISNDPTVHYLSAPGVGTIAKLHNAANGESNAAFIAAANPQTVIALLDEIERLRGRVLQPLTEREIQQALHEGRAEAIAATGDNAWTSLLKQRDEAREQLSAMTAARDEACTLLYAATGANGPMSEDAKAMFRSESDRLRKVGA